MALKEADTINFDTLMKAIKDGNCALVEVKDRATGEYRAAVCAVGRLGGDYAITPFAVMVWDDPFQMFIDPETSWGMDKAVKQ
jgi:Family of unknown function (DUF6117)